MKLVSMIQLKLKAFVSMLQMFALRSVKTTQLVLASTSAFVSQGGLVRSVNKPFVQIHATQSEETALLQTRVLASTAGLIISAILVIISFQNNIPFSNVCLFQLFVSIRVSMVETALLLTLVPVTKSTGQVQPVHDVRH